jgi:hypothetical protein
MTKSVDYMLSRGKKESEPVLGEGEFFTAGTLAPASRPHPRSARGLHILFF